jgi:AcrR family transcriptional regulator
VLHAADVMRERRGRRRRTILDAALRCFLVRGVEATTMNRIRTASGATIGSIYHLFEGKEEIALTLHRDGRRDYERGFLELLVDRGAEFGVKAAVFHHLRWVRRNRPLALFIHRCPRPEEQRHGRRPARELSRSWLEDPSPDVMQYAQRWLPALAWASLAP